MATVRPLAPSPKSHRPHLQHNSHPLMITACPPTLKAKQLEIGIIDYEPGPDVVLRTCELCGTSIHIGLFQLVYIAAHPETTALCFACARNATVNKPTVRILGAQGGEYTVQRKENYDRSQS
jgi:hypothetical protein